MLKIDTAFGKIISFIFIKWKEFEREIVNKEKKNEWKKYKSILLIDFSLHDKVK